MPDVQYAAAFAQQRLWLLQALEPEETAYHVTEAFRVSGPLDRHALWQAAREACARHEALRTRFEQVDGEIIQVVADPYTRQAEPGFHQMTTSDCRQDRAATVSAFCRAVATRPFNLQTGPLLRIHVAELDPGEHAMVIAAHHIACDGWSMGLLLRELSELYRSFLLDEPIALPEPDLQYTDYSIWERDNLDAARVEECLRYWRGHLAGAPMMLSLPAARPRRPTGFPESGVHEFVLPMGVTPRLHEIAHSTKSTLPIVLLAVFNIFLARITGEWDVVVGYPVNGRTQAGSESLVGMLVNTLPLRGDMRDDPTFEQLLLRVRDSVLNGHEYADLPFERIVEEFNPDRIQGINPLVQVMFQVLDNTFGDALRLEGTKVQRISAAQPTTFLDLSLDVYREGGTLRASFNYSRDLFDHETMVRFAECFQTLLAAAIDSPDARMSELPLLSQAAESRLLGQLGAGPVVSIPSGATVLGALDTQIGARAQDVAVADSQREWTYQELGVAIDALAGNLIARGVGRGDPVGLMVTRSSLLPVGVFGILRAGAVLVPLDAANPIDRLRNITAQTSMRLVVTDASTRPAAERLALPLLNLSAVAVAPVRTGVNRTAPGPNDAAYIVFTSGSTSTPKGVVVQHGALANLYYSHRNSHYRAMASSVGGRRLRVAYTMSIAFDASWDQLLWMVDGNRLCVVDDDTARDAQQLIGALSEHEIDVLEATPSFLEQLVDLGLLDQKRHGPSLFVLGGEAMRASLWSRLAAEPGLMAVNLYGPTEFTVDALGAVVGDAARPAVGRPVANCRVVLLDTSGRPVPIGVVGEICLSGPQLALGYLNDPRQTAEKFIPDPFASVPGARMYRTGDLGRFRTDGQVEYVGRIDGQLKIRGYRVDPGEVESAFLGQPGVIDAVVLSRKDLHGRDQLVGYVAANEGLNLERLWKHVADSVPEYMLPSAIVQVGQIPRSISGKVDAACLPAPKASSMRTASFVAPAHGVEQDLAQLFAEVLGMDAVGRFDDFFRLGGHSLSAIQLISRVRARLGAEISLRTVFDHPTVAGLAAALGGRAAQPQSIPLLEQRDRAAVSTAQKRVWIVQQISPEDRGYNMVEILRLRGTMDVRVLAEAIGVVVARHDVLRSRFEVDTHGGPGERSLLQVVDPAWGGEAACHDLTSLSSQQAWKRAMGIVHEFSQRDYDLASGPLFAAAIISLGPGDHLLVFGLHHIICDGWSVKVLLSEISSHYRDLTAESAPRLPPLRIQYQDFGAWESCLDDGQLGEHLAYWRVQLAGAPTALALPHDRPRPAARTGQGDTVRFEVSAALTAALTDLARQHSTTLFSVLLAGFDAVLARWTGQQVLMVGVPGVGRAQPELENLIGMFINLLPMQADLSGDPTFAELLDQVRDTVLSGFAHEALGFERLVELVNPRRELAMNPLVQVTCQLFEDSGAAGLEIDGVTVESVPHDSPNSRFDLSLDLTRRPDGLSGQLHFDTDLFERPTAVAVTEAILAFLGEVSRAPTQRVWQVPLLLPATTRALSVSLRIKGR